MKPWVIKNRPKSLSMRDCMPARTLAEDMGCFRTLFRSSPDAVLIIHPTADKVLDFNPRLCEVLGYSRKELLSLPAMRILRYRPILLQNILEPDSTKRDASPLQIEFRHKSGRPILADVSASLISLSGTLCILAVVRNISERQRAEKAEQEILKGIEFLQLLNTYTIAPELSGVEESIRLWLGR